MGVTNTNIWMKWQTGSHLYSRRLFGNIKRLGDCGRPGRRTAFLSVLGVVLLALTAPKVLPVWCLKSVAIGCLSQLTALKLDTDVITGLAMAGGFLTEAREEVDRERRNTAAERDAFVEFSEQVETISPVNQPTIGGMTAHVSNNGAGHQQLEQVRERYRNTVMSVPDFEHEYDEALPEHLCAEFGNDVATIVVSGQRFNRPVQQMLVEKARQSAQEREELIRRLDDEKQSLDRATSELRPVRAFLEDTDKTKIGTYSVSQLAETDIAIQEYQNQCERTLRTRQQEIHTASGQASVTRNIFQTYLYRNLDVSFPVLQAALNCLDRLGKRRSVLIRSLCQRV